MFVRSGIRSKYIGLLSKPSRKCLRLNIMARNTKRIILSRKTSDAKRKRDFRRQDDTRNRSMEEMTQSENQDSTGQLDTSRQDMQQQNSGSQSGNPMELDDADIGPSHQESQANGLPQVCEDPQVSLSHDHVSTGQLHVPPSSQKS